MSDVSAPSTLRITVRGALGTVDLSAPPGAVPDALAREYAAVVGAAEPPVLVSITGTPLDPVRPLEHLRVRSGDVLVALDPSQAGSPTAPQPAEAAPGKVAPSLPAPSSLRPLLAGLAAVSGATACVAGALAPVGPARTGAVAVLLLAALVSAVAVSRADRSLVRVHSLCAPAFAGIAGFLLVHSPTAGGTLLAVTVGGLAACVAAAVVRTGADPRTESLLRVWLVAAGAIALSAAVALATGTPERAVWAGLFTAAVVAARLLPHLVVDVSDETLLDLDRLAVTAWSARERPRGGRRRLVIRPDGVAELVREGRAQLVAGTAAVAVVASVTGLLLMRAPGEGIDLLGVHLLLLFGGGALALTARSYRAAAPRNALRLPGALALVAPAASLLDELSGAWLWWSLSALATAAVAAVVAAVAMGRGWRSIWWTRTADVVEGMSVVLCIAALPVASGLFELVRQIPS